MIKTSLDDIALMSPLRYKNTGLKMLIAGTGLIAGVASESPILPLFIGSCMMAVTLIPGKVPAKPYLKLVTLAMGFALISSLVIAFFSASAGGDILYRADLGLITLTVTAAGAEQALLVVCRSFGGVCCLFFLSMTTPMLEMFSGMKRISFLDTFAELTMMIYRYIFVFLEMFLNIQAAQSMRFGYKGFRNSIRSAGMLAGSLLVRTMDQADKLFLSMNARCYDGKLHYYESKKPISAKDVILTVLFMTAVLAVHIIGGGYRVFL